MSNQPPKNLNKFYFNTGVKRQNSSASIPGHEWSSNNVKVIPFECDAPKDARLMFCCDNPDLPESKSENVIVREMFNTVMVSKYAYLMVTAEEKKNLERDEVKKDKYDNQQIAREIRATASGQAYHGNALYVARDMPCVIASPEHRLAVQRYLDGTDKMSDYPLLQEVAMLIDGSRVAEDFRRKS